ncbi:hypothetical protein C6P46_004176 [Rhodotorula mucilaginosa]|uniref:GATA-type domain-containing protein n=1 Tax=Rhodotorula mucilaginosa TaxID=5537 RepID=A0A9P6W0B6_RHOMI|nr:hypothetical protein C6P46_004176 [Rhodotorula mucilaginosa]
MATQYAVSQPPATSGTAAAGYQDKTAEYGYEDPQHNPASATASEFDRQNRQESWPGTANASDSPFPLHQTFSPHIPPASTGTHHHAISGIGSPFPPFSPHGHFGDSLSSGTGGGGGGEAGASPQHQQFHHPTHSPTHAGEHNTGVPEIGHVRCYWAILSAELEYAYLGPVFAAHLGDEVAERLKGTSLLDWVHPDERDQLAKDLLPHPDRLAGVEETGVFGSVTRCRFSRIIRMMRNLGHPNVPKVPEAALYAIDDDWLDLDVTTSWIAGDCSAKGKGKTADGRTPGAVLAFFHVSNDKDPVQDNDVHVRNGWSNWCGVSLDWGPYLSPKLCDELVETLKRLTGVEVPSRPSTGRSDGSDKGTLGEVLNGTDTRDAADDADANAESEGPPSHVFQILDQLGRPIVTFPEPKKGREYDVERYSTLAQEVMARPAEAAPSRTSCTRRYRSKHPEMRTGEMHTIESVVIMYGDITFACFQTGGVYLSPSRKLTGLTIPEGPSFDATTIEGKHFALEDVPTTPNVNSSVGRKRFPFEGTDGDEQEAQQPAKRQRPALQPPTLPRLQTSAPSPVGEMASPLQNNHPQQQNNGLSISTAGNMFRQNLEVDSMSAAGGISPTVASASAILGSLGDVMQQRQQQRTPLPPSPLQHSSTNPDGGRLPPPAFGPQAHHLVSPTAPAFPPPTASGSGPGQSYDDGNMLPPLPRSPFERQGGTGDSYFPQGSSSQAGQGGDGKSPEQGQPSSYAGGGGGAGLEANASAEWPLFERHERPGELAVTGPTGGKRGRHRPDGPVFKPNVKACESCGTINSPEWRKGPSGVKSLCNACGLRYARHVSREKKKAEQRAIVESGGTIPKKTKKKKASAGGGAKASKAEQVKEAAAAAAGGLTDERSEHTSVGSTSASGSAPNSLPPTSQATYDAHAGYALPSPHAQPTAKPYSPYYTTAPPMPGQYSHASTPGLHTPQYPSPLPQHKSASYFPAISAAVSSYPYSLAISAPITSHAPVLPSPHVGPGYQYPPPSHLPHPALAAYPNGGGGGLHPPTSMSSSHSPSPYSPYPPSPHAHSPNPGAATAQPPMHSPHGHTAVPPGWGQPSPVMHGPPAGWQQQQQQAQPPSSEQQQQQQPFRPQPVQRQSGET